MIGRREDDSSSSLCILSCGELVAGLRHGINLHVLFHVERLHRPCIAIVFHHHFHLVKPFGWNLCIGVLVYLVDGKESCPFTTCIVILQ